MKPKPILTIIVLTLILLALTYMWPFTKQPKILETRTFSCQGMEGFTFEYPVFEGSEVTEPKKYDDADICTFRYISVSPQGEEGVVLVTKLLNDGTLAYTDFNSQNVGYTKLTDAKAYIFGAAEQTIKVELSHIQAEAADLFFQTVINSFQLINISREKALDIAREDAGKSKTDLSRYTAKAELEKDRWHVYYVSKEHERGGGGPEYIIDARTGKIVSKTFAR